MSGYEIEEIEKAENRIGFYGVHGGNRTAKRVKKCVNNSHTRSSRLRTTKVEPDEAWQNRIMALREKIAKRDMVRI